MVPIMEMHARRLFRPDIELRTARLRGCDVGDSHYVGFGCA